MSGEINPYRASEVEPPKKNLAAKNPAPSLAWEILIGSCAVFAASLAMAATMPGRTHGLGMITVPLLKDFPSLSEFGFATLNFWATLLGSVLCIPCGWLLDRFRINVVGFIVVVVLAGAVLGMSQTESIAVLAIMLTLTRCFGQSMLSVVSLAIIGKSFPRRPAIIMGLYAVVMTMMMATWMGVLQGYLPKVGWRDTWWGMGIALVIIAPVLMLITPWRLKGTQADELQPAKDEAESATLWQAITSPCFWTFAVAISLFGLISSGFSLFQESIFAAQGLDRGVYYSVLIAGLFVGLGSNLIGGLLGFFIPLPRLLFVAMALVAVGLAMVPFIHSQSGAYWFCFIYGTGGGLLTVLFFTVWGPAFGTKSLARIQGAAQMLTVVASAAGPLCVTGLRMLNGSDTWFLFFFAGLSLLLGVVALHVPVPSAARGDWSRTRSFDSDLKAMPETAR